MALVEPEAVPVTVMCMAVPMTIVMALRERSHIDVGGFATIMTGRVLGIAGGVVLLSVVRELPDDPLQQTAVLVVLIVTLFLYALIGTIPFTPVTIAGLNLGVAGILCLAGGLIAGLLFLFLSRRSLSKFRYR